MAVAPLAAQVGLQVLLQPYSNTIGHIACTAVGVMYPSYASFKAVELMRLRNDDSEAARWLTYWAVYGAINTLERLLDRALPWVPYYSTLKLALLLWLQVPRYSGAFRVSNEFARPLLRKIHRHVDEFLEALELSMRPLEIAAAADVINIFFSRIPVLEWFVRGPDGRPVQPPPPPSQPRSFLGLGRS